MQTGLIVTKQNDTTSQKRARYYQKKHPEKTWLVINERNAISVIKKTAFNELIFLPETKEYKKSILKEVTSPIKLRLLSESLFLTVEEEKTKQTSFVSLPQIEKKEEPVLKQKSKKTALLLGTMIFLIFLFYLLKKYSFFFF